MIKLRDEIQKWRSGRYYCSTDSNNDAKPEQIILFDMVQGVQKNI